MKEPQADRPAPPEADRPAPPEADRPAPPEADGQRRARRTPARPAARTQAARTQAARTQAARTQAANAATATAAATTEPDATAPALTDLPSGPTTRVVVSGVRPTTPDGVSDAKALLDRPLVVTANVFADGHDELAARVSWRPHGGQAQSVPMTLLGNDRWEARLQPETLGRHEFTVQGWIDHWATLAKRVRIKHDAGQDTSLELEEAARLIETIIERAPQPRLQAALAKLRGGDPGPTRDETLARALAQVPMGPVTTASPQSVWVDRPRAAIGAWYELFPRSFGGLNGAARRLPAIADMGFDVVYLPPVHPIGTTARKGRGNSLTAKRGDPGSPWAIGAAAGGHTALDPGLGTFEDFDAFVATANHLGMEVALDLAYQCSPDHPWVHQHPEWFQHRPDGTIRFAENPPKQYQDIYPLDFLPPSDDDRRGLWNACRDVVEHWIGHGVRVFRVDNPHTKPFAFWHWLLEDVRSRHPDIVWLAEAFTRPRVMERLAEIGFSQGYTYFTWRTTKAELTEYALELAYGPASDYFRPNLWPNTPDILSGPLRHGSLGVFKVRAVLAATLGPSWGIYSGYELGENVPASDANEEYANSEKYEIADRDWTAAWSLAPYLTTLNDIRKRHPAISRGDLRFHHAPSDSIIAYTRQSGADTVLVVVNLDPDNTHEDVLWLDLGALGLPWDQPLVARDEISGAVFPWQGPDPFVRLDRTVPAHVIDLRAR